MIAHRAPTVAERMKRSASGEGECTSDFEPAIKKIQRELESESRLNRRNMVDHDKWLESVQSSLARRA